MFSPFAFACDLHIQLAEAFASRNVGLITATKPSRRVGVQLLIVLKTARFPNLQKLTFKYQDSDCPGSSHRCLLTEGKVPCDKEWTQKSSAG